MTMNKLKRAQHDCGQEHKFEPTWNKAVVPLGTLWICPTCRDAWMRTTEEFKGALFALGYEPLVWTRLTKRQRRWLDKLIGNAPTMRQL